MSGPSRHSDTRRTRSRYDPISRRRRSRSHSPRRKRSPERDEEPVLVSGFLKVSGHDDISKLAGKIAWNARRDEHLPLLASGTSAIAAAIDAIALARSFLGKDDEPLDLLCQPAFRSESKNASLAFYFSTLDARRRDIDRTPAEFTVSRSSKSATVAGAIAARAREDIGPLVTAIGDEAVCNAVMAICRARIYLEEDGLDIRFIVAKQAVEKTGADGKVADLDSVKLRIYVEDVE